MLQTIRDPNLAIRLTRAQSWLGLAESEKRSEHARFTFYWITFNCMYGLSPVDPDHLDKEPESQRTEIRRFIARVKDMTRYDRDSEARTLDRAIHKCIPQAKALIEDPFLSYKYWEGDKSPLHIETTCKAEWEHAREGFTKKGEADSLLDFAFYRLIVLRNQVIHGSMTATPESKGFQSLLSGVGFLQVIIPAFYYLLVKHGDQISKWPKALTPVRGIADILIFDRSNHHELAGNTDGNRWLSLL